MKKSEPLFVLSLSLINEMKIGTLEEIAEFVSTWVDEYGGEMGVLLTKDNPYEHTYQFYRVEDQAKLYLWDFIEPTHEYKVKEKHKTK